MRLVDHEADQDAGQPRTLVQQQQSAAEQRSVQKAVLAVHQVDEGRRKGERDQQRIPMVGNPPHQQQVEPEGDRKPARQSHRIGKEGQRRDDEIERRRIVPEEDAGVGWDRRHLARVDLVVVERPGRVAHPRQVRRRVEGDEVIAQRTAERVEPVVARHVDQPRHDSDRVADHQQQAVVAHAVGVHQPVQILEPQRHLPWKASKLTHQA